MPVDITQLRNFANEHGLHADCGGAGPPAGQSSAAPRRSSRAHFRPSFLTIMMARGPSARRSGSLSLPSELLADRRIGARTRHAARGQPRLVMLPAAAAAAAYRPNQVAALYGFRPMSTAKGNASRSSSSAAAYACRTPDRVQGHGPDAADGGWPCPWTAAPTNQHLTTAPTAKSHSTSRWPAVRRPGATIAVYFAPNTDAGFVDAITSAVHDTHNHRACFDQLGQRGIQLDLSRPRRP